MAKKSGAQEKNTHLSHLLNQDMSGEEVVIPHSRDVPVEAATSVRAFGTAKGIFILPPDWDAPLTDEVLAEFYK